MNQPTEPVGGDHARLPAALGELVDSDDLDRAQRARLLGRLAAAAGETVGVRRLVMGPRAAVKWALDTLIDVAPRLPIRDLDMLRRHYDGRTGDELAEVLVRNASRVTAAIGGAGGALAAVEWAAPPALLTAPVLIAAETVAVVAVEVKLIAELHEVYGQPVAGSAADKAGQLLGAWAHRRGVSLLHPGRGVTSVLGAGLRKELRERLLKRMGRNLTTFGPMLTGAAVAGELNRRATRSIGAAISTDLRRSAARQLPRGR